jgi:hypothetical protein
MFGLTERRSRQTLVCQAIKDALDVAAAFPRFARRQPPPRLVRQRDQDRQTGADMQSKYKEASLRGLAVNFVEC